MPYVGHYVPYMDILQARLPNRTRAGLGTASRGHSFDTRVRRRPPARPSRLRPRGRGAGTMSTTDKRVEELLDRWLASVELHARYLKLDDAAYARAEAWPKHQRPNALVVNLARTRLLELKAHLSERRDAGDATICRVARTDVVPDRACSARSTSSASFRWPPASRRTRASPRRSNSHGSRTCRRAAPKQRTPAGPPRPGTQTGTTHKAAPGSAQAARHDRAARPASRRSAARRSSRQPATASRSPRHAPRTRWRSR